MRSLTALVVPVRAARQGFWVVARRQPLLGDMPEPQVIRRRRAAHACRYPARVDGIADRLLTQPGRGGGQCGDEELAVGVGRRTARTAPVDSFQGGMSAAVHAAAEVDVPLCRYEGGEEERGDDVDLQEPRARA